MATKDKDFVRGVMARVVVLKLFLMLLRSACDDEALTRIFDQHRGRGYEAKIRFCDLVRLLLDALIPYGTSTSQILRSREQQGELDATRAAYYRKLGHLSPDIGQALVFEAASRLRALRPQGKEHPVPSSLKEFNLLRGDGKTIKSVARRLQPARKFKSGALLGGKCLLGFECQSGLTTLMQATLDGESNDLPLVPGWWKQAEKIPGPRLVIVDSQYCDTKQPAIFTQYQGDHWLTRYHPKVTFHLTSTVPAHTTQDATGRTVVSEWGELQAKGKPPIPVRRIRVERPGQKELILVTSLTESRYKTLDILEAYGLRWDIEEMLSKVSQVFDLQKLISSSAQGTVFQLALCTVLYNVIEVMRQWLTPAGQAPGGLSIARLYGRVRQELTGVTVLLTFEEAASGLEELSQWSSRSELEDLAGRIPITAFAKSPNKPRKPPPVKQPLPNGHTSIYRLMHPGKAST